jgi:hypothetical protein
VGARVCMYMYVSTYVCICIHTFCGAASFCPSADLNTQRISWVRTYVAQTRPIANLRTIFPHGIINYVIIIIITNYIYYYKKLSENPQMDVAPYVARSGLPAVFIEPPCETAKLTSAVRHKQNDVATPPRHGLST